MVRVLGLQRADQKFELGKTSQTCEGGIFQKIRPASEPGTDAPFQPLKSSFASPGEGERAGDLIVGMMRVAKRLWTRTGPGHAVDCRVLIPHQSVEQAL